MNRLAGFLFATSRRSLGFGNCKLKRLMWIRFEHQAGTVTTRYGEQGYRNVKSLALEIGSDTKPITHSFHGTSTKETSHSAFFG